jgi:signal transduction histidine kinase
LCNGEGELVVAVEIFEDISDFKFLEQERSNLISMIAHDMRSSITGIHGLSLRLLRKAVHGNEGREHQYLEVITKEAARLETMVEDFLEYSRLQTGRFKFTFSPTSLNKLLVETFETYKLQAQQRGLQLKLSIGGIMPVIQADSYRLRRVFTNLLDNALKFSKAGGTITITAGESASEVFVRIEDEGLGMAADDLPYIFDLFRRGKGVGKQEGYGIGLATVRAVVEGHGGRVMVASEPGKGSIFAIFLPKGAGVREETLNLA